MTETGKHVPPAAVAKMAEKGLDLRERFKRGGTQVGVSRARDLKNRQSLSDETLKRMRSYFARHKVDKRAANFGDDDNPSAGYVAWLLWGGDAGRDWVAKQMDETSDKAPKKNGAKAKSAKSAQSGKKNSKPDMRASAS
ncbi:hypothetical protein [Xaviernesmea oryzae]|uniref:hypothetical protein n=1 Tax=Xaviernesmea oryzae TaxID=464029 RepID=UPI0008C364F9|nr:hypothetical protein [Xaviernesmea oryzae]SEL13263.1 hypothetical protein SAMN04487976_10629 [Xaviernesmea oryzae]